MSFHSPKFFSRPLLLVSAALLIQTGSVVAADSAGDVQRRIKEVLAGTVVIQSAPSSERRDERAVGRIGDLQEFARQLLLGATDTSIRDTKVAAQSENAAPRESSPHKDRPSHGDGQTLAQRVLLGQRNALTGG